MLGLAIIVLVVLVVHFFKHPERGFYLLIFSIPFQPYSVPLEFMTLTAPNILTILMAFIITARFILGYDKLHIFRHRSSTFVLVLLFLLFISAILSLITAKNMVSTLRRVVTAVGGILLFGIVMSVLNDIQKFKTTLVVLIISVTFVSIITILNGMNITTQIFPLTIGKIRANHPMPIAGYELPFLRNIGVIHGQGTYGIWVFSALPLLFVISFNQDIKLLILKSRILFFILLLIVFVGIVISQSRNVWLGAVITFNLTIFFLLMKRFQSYSKIALIGITILMLILGSSTLISIVRYYANTYYSNIEGRILGYEFALFLFTQSPLTGVGDEVFEKLFIYAGRRNSALHNTFLQFLVTKGLLGFIPFTLLVISSIVFIFCVTKYSKTEEFKLLGICLLVSLVAMVTESLFIPGAADKGMWFLLGLANGLYLIHNEYRQV